MHAQAAEMLGKVLADLLPVVYLCLLWAWHGLHSCNCLAHGLSPSQRQGMLDVCWPN
jgi:hypothetical protein